MYCRIPLTETRGIWGRKGKEDPQQVPHDARPPTTKETTTKNVYSTSVGSTALPGSEANNYTHTKVQRKTTERTREWTKGISSTPAGQTRERMRKRRERENWDWVLGSRGRDWAAGPALMTVTAATSAAAGTNQRPPRADLAPSPCCARGLHSVRVAITLSPEKHVPGCEGSATLL